jgi:hypothetical protein
MSKTLTEKAISSPLFRQITITDISTKKISFIYKIDAEKARVKNLIANGNTFPSPRTDLSLEGLF